MLLSRVSSGVKVHGPALSGDWSAKPGYVPKPNGQPSWFDAPRCNTPPTYQSASSDNEGR